MDLFSLLKKDHQEMQSILHQLISKPDPKREGLRDLQEALADLLVNHAKMEENYLYSRMREVESCRELLTHSVEEHEEALRVLKQVQTQRIESHDWVEACKSLLKALEEHIQVEETTLLPAVQRSLNATEISRIFQQMLQFREEHLLITPDIALSPD